MYKHYEGYVYPELNLRTTKYLEREERFGGSIKMFSESLKTAKKDKPIKLQIEEGLSSVTKPHEKKIVERSKFANQSLRSLLGKQREAEREKESKVAPK